MTDKKQLQKREDSELDGTTEPKRMARNGSTSINPTSPSPLRKGGDEEVESPSRTTMGLKKGSTSNSAIKLVAVSEKSRDKNDKLDKQAKGKSPDRDKDRAGRPDKADKDKKEKDPREKSVRIPV